VSTTHGRQALLPDCTRMVIKTCLSHAFCGACDPGTELVPCSLERRMTAEGAGAHHLPRSERYSASYWRATCGAEKRLQFSKPLLTIDSR